VAARAGLEIRIKFGTHQEQRGLLQFEKFLRRSEDFLRTWVEISIHDRLEFAINSNHRQRKES
jgi:hypothetical protein